MSKAGTSLVVHTTPLPTSNPSDTPKRREYATDQLRLKTFDTWPSNHPISPERLARAGLWYTGTSDRVRCFHCGGGLKEFEPNDDPIAEHKRIFPYCDFINNLPVHSNT